MTILFRRGRRSGSSHAVLDIAGQQLPLIIRRHPGALRASLRIAVRGGIAVVTLPPAASDADAMRLALEQADWLRNRISALPIRVPFEDGAMIPVQDVLHRIRYVPEDDAAPRLDDGEIRLGGSRTRLPERVATFLRQEARRVLTARATVHASSLGLDFHRLTVRDTRSRWGSCSAAGDLSFSWRLILGPPHVLDYVVAHEVAHLGALNHGPRFQALLARLISDPQSPRAWLRRYGLELHRYG